MNNKEIVIKVEDLAISFATDHGRLHAVRGVSFELYRGEVLAIVGESGSGKSVSAKTIMGILPRNGRIEKGSIMYEGEDLTRISEEDFHRLRGKKIGMIFQDPLSSLNPIMKVGRQLTEAIIINADKVKQKYNDLISPQLIALNNRRVQDEILISEKENDVIDFIFNARQEMSAIRKNTALSKEEKKAAINKVRAGIKAKRAEKRAFVKSIHADSKPIIKALALELVAAKKAAKIETLKFKKDLTDKRDAELSALTAKLKATSDAEERKAIEAQIEKVKTEYINNVRITRAEAKKQALKVMEEVGIPQPARRFRQYPFEFSGGMRQRIVIAIALIQNPDVLICDEPTTALDVTIQAQILELINRLKRERNLSVIFITHDLGVVANMADRVAVMYAGKIVEYGLVNELFYDPRHPYTWALLSSIPDVDSRERLEAIPGTPPNMVYPPKGDAFAPRSRYAMAIDFKEEPPYFKVSETHYAKTWLLDPRAPKAEMPNIVASRIKNSLKKGGKKDE